MAEQLDLDLGSPRPAANPIRPTVGQTRAPRTAILGCDVCGQEPPNHELIATPTANGIVVTCRTCDRRTK